MDPTTQFYISFGAQVLFGGIQIYYQRKQFRQTTPNHEVIPHGTLVNRQWTLFIMVIAGLLVWAPMYLTLRDNAPHLTNYQKSTMLNDVTKMRTLMSAIIISYTNGDPNTEPLAHDLADVFNRAGIEPVFGFTRPDNPDQSGIIISIKDLNNPPPGVENLKTALTSSNIIYKLRAFPKRGFDGVDQNVSVNRDLVIWVAPNPL